MESSTRFSSKLGRRSIVARLAALLALVACGVAIYLVVMAFTEDEGGGGSKNDKKGRSEQANDQKEAASATSYTVGTGDTLSAIAVETGVPEPRIERLNPDVDAESLNAGQTLALR
jgi:LysM repeat protein